LKIRGLQLGSSGLSAMIPFNGNPLVTPTFLRASFCGMSWMWRRGNFEFKTENATVDGVWLQTLFANIAILVAVPPQTNSSDRKTSTAGKQSYTSEARLNTAKKPTVTPSSDGRFLDGKTVEFFRHPDWLPTASEVFP